MDRVSRITWLDYVVLALIMMMSILIGLYHGFRDRIKSFFSNRVVNEEKNDDGGGGGGGEIELTTTNEAAKTPNSKTSEYLMANSSIGTLPVAFSLLASFYSATALVGMPAEVYQYGIGKNFNLSYLNNNN